MSDVVISSFKYKGWREFLESYIEQLRVEHDLVEDEERVKRTSATTERMARVVGALGAVQEIYVHTFGDGFPYPQPYDQ